MRNLPFVVAVVCCKHEADWSVPATLAAAEAAALLAAALWAAA
jgi:hypothetical protein